MINCVAFIVPFILYCIPPDAFWLEDNPSDKCLNHYALEISRSIPHIATDLVMIFVPIPTIYQLQVSRKLRHAIAAMFITGIM